MLSNKFIEGGTVIIAKIGARHALCDLTQFVHFIKKNRVGHATSVGEFFFHKNDIS